MRGWPGPTRREGRGQGPLFSQPEEPVGSQSSPQHPHAKENSLCRGPFVCRGRSPSVRVQLQPGQALRGPLHLGQAPRGGSTPMPPPHPLELPKNPWRTPAARVRVGGYRQRCKERRAVPTVTARGYGTLPDQPMQPLCLGLIQMPVENSRLLPLPRRSTQGPPPGPLSQGCPAALWQTQR